MDPLIRALADLAFAGAGVVLVAAAVRGNLGSKLERLACRLCDVEETKETP